MAIHFITGKPGGGKSLFSLRRVVRELLDSDRTVVTNLPIHPGKLNDWLQRNHPDKAIRLLDRLQLLDDKQTAEFWKHRGPVGFEAQDGVLYVLDELHLFFNARDWMKTGRDCLQYISQHRHFGDELYCVTQALGNVDKQFRSVAQDFAVVRNEYMAKLGPFRGQGRFKVRVYAGEPGQGEPFETITFTLDGDLKDTYDTAAGVGIQGGNKADKGARAKGIPILWAIPMWIAVASCLVWVPMVGVKWYTSKMASVTKLTVPSEARPASDAGQGLPLMGGGQAKAQVETPGVTMTGYLIEGRKLWVSLSDGTILDERDVKVLKANAVTLHDGRTLPRAKPVILAPVAVIPQAPLPWAKP